MQHAWKEVPNTLNNPIPNDEARYRCAKCGMLKVIEFTEIGAKIHKEIRYKIGEGVWAEKQPICGVVNEFKRKVLEKGVRNCETYIANITKYRGKVYMTAKEKDRLEIKLALKRRELTTYKEQLKNYGDDSDRAAGTSVV